MAFLILSGLVFLVPSGPMYQRIKFYRLKWRRRSLVYRGRELETWLETFTMAQNFFNLNTSLPDPKIYKSFGHHLHELWSKVQKEGGALKPLLRYLRLLLRKDLQRTQRELDLVKSSYAQIFVMTAMVAGYLAAFVFLIEISFPLGFWAAAILWQLLGHALYFWWLGTIKKRTFGPLNGFLEDLILMGQILHRGGLGQVYLKAPLKPLSGRDAQFRLKVEALLEQWKFKGNGQKESLDELEEDLMILVDDKEQAFLRQIKVMGTMWAMVFLLPLLLGASLFGLYKFTVV